MSIRYKIITVTGTVLGLILFTWGFISFSNQNFPREETVTAREASVIAESWIRNFSSYTPYGKDLQLTHEEEIDRGVYGFVFEFVTEEPDYGKRRNEIVLQTKDTEVVNAVTNGVFDEIEKVYIEKETTILVYLVTKDEQGEKEIVPVERIVTEERENEEGALRELLKGLTQEETEEGYETLIDNETELLYFDKEGRTAYFSLSNRLENLSPLAKKQLENTVMQFNTIDYVKEPERGEITRLEIEGIPEGFAFERDLEEGSTGENVRYLQIILNADPDTKVAESGPGSPGYEVENFGPATADALMAFQRKYATEILEPAGLILSTGVVDVYTRDKLNAILEESKW